MQKKCSGCGGCMVICPKKCISLEKNNQGYFKEKTDYSKCINCGLCKKICPMREDIATDLNESKLFSAYSNNQNVRLKSSSGGIAYLLAKNGIEHGFKILGCKYDYEANEAKHIILSDLKNLDKIQGSKYLQSDTKVFKEMIELARKDKNTKFMVFGTPCQISAIRNLVDFYKITKQFLLIDIFCHGVPSYLLWDNYLEWLENKGIKKEKIDNIVFRDKNYSWHEYFMHITARNKEYISSRKKDPFLKLFSMGALNQRECFTCNYRNKSSADIRLGDYWGKRYEKSEEGFSMLLINTKDGESLFNEFSKEMSITVNEFPINERLGQQHENYPIPRYYDESFELIKEKNGMKRIISLYDPFSNREVRAFKEFVKKIIIK